MTTTTSSSSKTIAGIIAFLGWFALIAQFVLMFEARTTSVGEMMVRFFSYFTILCNTLVTVYCTLQLFPSDSAISRFFSRATTATAIAVYITIVGLVYNTILRLLWKPEGTQQLVDELLHTFLPLAFMGYWLFFVVKKELTWTSFFPWLIFPFVYCIYILIRGSFSNFYPYPFMDVNQLGYLIVIRNSIFVTAVFLCFSLLFIGIGKLRNQRSEI
ncbi:MAG: hypothetical protein JWO58_936 [Chitinophagaceae bacterium]|nr:hypothetical protein [Chitinophagaceae bacterium]